MGTRAKKQGMRLLGILLMVLGLSYAGFLLYQGQEAAIRSQTVMAGLNQLIPQTPQIVGSDDGTMPVEMVDGTSYIGTLQIPNEKLELPVSADYAYEQLTVSPTRFLGSYFTNDMVICAHDYLKHFQPIKDIAPGTDVYFKTAKGQVYHYKVTNRFEIKPTDVDQVIKDSDQQGDWDLTLFTCTASGAGRMLVRCSLVNVL